MRQYRHWVTYRLEVDEKGSIKKVPYCPATHCKAVITNANTWSRYNDAVTALATGDYNGIGYVFSADDPYIGIDLDHCRIGAMTTEQQKIYDRFAPLGYVEISPSRNGIHIISKGTIPRGRRRAGIEIYSTGRYFTMTGNEISAGPISDAQAELDATFAEWTSSDTSQSSSKVALGDGPQCDDDNTVLRRALSGKNGAKIKKLLNGDIGDYGNDNSAADLALCSILYAVTQNGDQIWRIIQNSALGRDKHNRADYRDATLAKARQQQAQPFWAGIPMPSAELMASLTKQWDAIRGAPTGMPAVAATASPADVLPIISAADWEDKPIPPRRELIAGLIPMGVVGGMSGPGGSGKSTVAMQLSFAVTTGKDFLGLPVREPGPVLYVACEDDISELQRRVAQIARSEGVPLRDLAGLHIAPMAGLDALLAVPDRSGGTLRATPLLATLDISVAAIRPKLLMLDNLTDVFAGNEIDRSHARQFVGMLRKVAIDYDLTVLILSHPSKLGESDKSLTSGSTAWNNSYRFRLGLDRKEAKSDISILEVLKANYSAIGRQIHLEWKSGVFHPVADIENNKESIKIAEDRFDELFMQLLTEAIAGRHQLSRSPSSPSYAPKLFAEHATAKANSVTKQGFAAAMNRLLMSGRITVVHIGPPSKSKEVIQIAHSVFGGVE